MRKDVKANREDIITNRKLITNITVDIDVNKEDIADLTISINGQIAAIEEDLVALKHTDEQLQLQISKLKDNFAALKYDFYVLNLTTIDEINILNGDMSVIKEDIKKLQDKVDELDIQDSVLETAIKNLKDDLKVLQIQFDDISARTTQLETTSHNHGIRLNNLDDVVSDLRIDLDYLKERVDKLNQADNGMENVIENLTEKFNQLADDLDAVSKKSDQGDEAVLILINDQISELETDLQTLSNRVDSSDAVLLAAIDKVRSDLTKLEDDLVAISDPVGEFGRYKLSDFVINLKSKMNLEERSGSEAFQLTSNDQVLYINVTGYYRLLVSIENIGNWDDGWISIFLRKNNYHTLAQT